MLRLELATLGYKPSALAIELNSAKAIAEKEFLCSVELPYFSYEKSTTVEK